MAKWQRWESGVRRHSYKALPPLFAFEGFWETAPRFAPLQILRNGVVGRYLGFRATTARIAHLSSQFVTAHQIFADFSAICYGSVITTVQPLLHFFLQGFHLWLGDCLLNTSGHGKERERRGAARERRCSYWLGRGKLEEVGVVAAVSLAWPSMAAVSAL